jgi:hypothetical protein
MRGQLDDVADRTFVEERGANKEWNLWTCATNPTYKKSQRGQLDELVVTAHSARPTGRCPYADRHPVSRLGTLEGGEGACSRRRNSPG